MSDCTCGGCTCQSRTIGPQIPVTAGADGFPEVAPLLAHLLPLTSRP